MLKKFQLIFGFGLAWLFILSIPVGYDRKLYDVGYHYIVDTKPVHIVTSFVSSGFLATKNTAEEKVDGVVREVDKSLKKTTQFVENFKD